MYIPPTFKNNSIEDAFAFIQSFPFGLIVTQGEERPLATHLPFAVEKNSKRLMLYSHAAKTNPQLHKQSGKEVLLIFSYPNAYISPSNYEKSDNVPTWNYVAAHLYGKVSLLKEEKEQIFVLEKMIATFEDKYQQQWENISKKYKKALLSEIIAFKIEVREIQLQEKLSQDRSNQEISNIIHKTSKSTKESEKTIGIFMEEKTKNNI